MLPCKARERHLVQKLEQLDARVCSRNCGTQLFRHSERCKVKFKIRLTLEDLQFLRFQRMNETKYHLTDLAYYKRLVVLLNDA